MLQFFEGERGDSNPRIAAPQAAALTTWRRPPHIYKFNNSRVIFHSYFYLLAKFELFSNSVKFSYDLKYKKIKKIE